MSTELVTAQRWLRGQLVSNAPLLLLIGEKVYEFPAPQTAKPPYVMHDYRGGQDQTMKLLRGASRTATTLFFGVVAVGADQTVTTLDLVPIADAIDDALEGQTGQLDSVIITACNREQPLMGASIESGDVRRFLGGLYRVSVRPA